MSNGEPQGESIPLPNGSLFCVMPETERNWDHALGVSGPGRGGRLSLTFRCSAEPAGDSDRERIAIAEDFEFQFSKLGAPTAGAPFNIAARGGDKWLRVGTSILLPTACKIASEVATACPEFELAILNHSSFKMM